MTKLEIIKDEIEKDPNSVGYAGKTPAEQAIIMNEQRSKVVPEFKDVPGVWTLDYLVAKLKEKGILEDKNDPPSTQIEVTRSISSDLQLFPISQGDVEQALKL